MSQNPTQLGALPETGYVRQAQLIGQAPVSAEQAAANRRAGKRRVRVCTGVVPIIPWSSATLWRKVNSGEFVAPVKLSRGVTAWPVEAVREYLRDPSNWSRANAGQPSARGQRGGA